MERIEIDAAARKRIVSEIKTNFFVEAGAGSGKTTMLVNRMVAMVESGIDIKKICAITFTKAAAGEIYERFQKALIERSNPDYKWEDKGYDGQLPEPTDEKRKHCLEALQNIDLCFMGTIDSFCNMILSEHPYEANILSDSNIVTDAEAKILYRQIYVRICNGEYGSELKSLANSFRAVNKDDQDVFCLGMSIFMEHRNVHFKHSDDNTVNVDNDYADMRNELIDTVTCLAEHPKISYNANNPSREAWKVINDIRQDISRTWSYNFSSVLWALGKLKDIRVVPQALERYESSLGRFFKTGGANGKWLECNIEIDKCILSLLQKQQFNTALSFMLKCVPVIEKEMRDSGRLSYFDYLYYLRKMLERDAGEEGKLINYIYNRHSFFLIDEFQDTNPMQAEVFFYLSSEKPVSKWYECKPRPGSLFIVGDPKQSIYRFRSADVASFLRVKKLFEDGVGDTLELSRNFRSKKCLCEFYNTVFSDLLSTETINQSKFEKIPLPEAVTDEFQGVFNYNMETSSDNASCVAEIVKKLVGNEHYLIRGKEDKDLRTIRYSDIMVITYRKINLGSIIDEFTNQKIPIKVEGEVLFHLNEALFEMYRIYSAVVDNENIIALYSAITGKVYSLTKEEIMIFRSCGGRLSLKSDFDIEGCDNEVARKVASSLSELRELHQKSRNMSPAALLAHIMDQYKIYRFVETRNMEVVYFALELIRSAERTGIISTLKDGKYYLDDLLSGASDNERCLSLSNNEDRVHIANLHKVKGLEAPIVILSYDKKKEPNPSIRIHHDTDSVEGYVFILSKDHKEGKWGDYISTSDSEPEKNLEIEALNAEEIRKMYVAATRARNALIVSNFGKDKNCWCSLSPDSMPYIFDTVTDKPSDNRKYDSGTDADLLYEQAEKECILNSRTAEEISFTKETPSTLKLISKISEEASIDTDTYEESELKGFAPLMGTMIHILMETIVSTRNKMNPHDVIREIISEHRTATTISYEGKITEVLKGVANTISNGGYPQTNDLPNDILNILLTADEVYCEVPFCYKEESPDGVIIWNGVMDVVYCSEGKWHIVDYKTNADGNDLDIKYQNQLAAYVKAFKETTGFDADAKTYHIDV